MKFKVGDKVRVKSGLVYGRRYGAILYWDDFKDKDFIVEEYDSKDNTYRCFYNVSEYWLSEEMLEPAYAEGGYVPYHKIPTPEKPISIEEQFVKDTFKDRLDSAFEAWRKLGGATSLFHENTISIKEDKPMKFTFYFNVDEGTRVDKSCNGTIPTVTTTVVLDKFGDSNRKNCYSLNGKATCDKADYNMRQGVLEALANAVFDGNFEKAYNKAVKTNEFCERKDRTCHYCGQLFDTIAEKEAHEAWHVERKKARRERYLLRKRAKEIAFEEQAQKMAKEMIEK